MRIDPRVGNRKPVPHCIRVPALQGGGRWSLVICAILSCREKIMFKSPAKASGEVVLISNTVVGTPGVVGESHAAFGRCLQDAGEVGDGPDQGHSGGADSVPPAPSLPRAVKGPMYERRLDLTPAYSII